jgi:hypothetical protein
MIACIALACSLPARAQFNILGAINGTTDTVTLTVTGPLSAPFFSGAGSYALTALPNGTYTIVPNLAGYTFSPASRVVTVAGASVTNADFTATPVGGPIIANFTPTIGTTGSTITINGSNFIGVTEVRFGGITAASFSIVSASQLTAVVSSTGATGNVDVVNAIGTASLAGFTFTTGTVSVTNASAPVISSIANVSILANSTSAVIAFVVSDADTPVAVLTLFASSSDQTILQNGKISFSGSGSTRGVQFTPEKDAVGTVQVTIGVYDGQFTGATTISVTILPPSTPLITSFTPAAAQRFDQVRIVGRNLSGATQVFFGGTAALGLSVAGDTLITATVGTGASGSITVLAAGGIASAPGFTFLGPAPIIAGFNPTRGVAGTQVRIFGQNFVNVTNVTFGGVAAASINLISATEIQAVVGNGATGAVRVLTVDNSGSLAGFTYVPAPSVVGFAPSVGVAGTQVSIYGFGLLTTRRVRFGGVDAASFTIVSDTQVDAILGTGASGAVETLTDGGTASRAGFTYLGSGQTNLLVSGFSPTAQFADSAITIFGIGFSAANGVSIGGAAAQYQILSDTQIRAFVSRFAASGSVTVSSPLASSSVAGFTLLQPSNQGLPPTISTIPSQTAQAGTVLSIPFVVGSLSVPASALRVTASSSNPLLVPNGNVGISGTDAARTLIIQTLTGQTGQTIITLTVSDGQRSASTGFILSVTAPPQVPIITGFTPTSAGAGESVLISGTGLAGATEVTFGGVAARLVSASDTQIVAIVGGGASGEVRVRTAQGTAARSGFIFATPPIITSFFPTTIVTSGTVTISGTGFVEPAFVTFGGIPAAQAVVQSSERIVAVVTNGATGDVRVTTSRGSSTLGGFTFVPAGRNIPPSISPIPNQFSLPNRSLGPIAFTVDDINFPATALQVYPASSNQTLLPVQNIVVSGAGAARTVSLFPTANQTGSSLVTLVVYNGVLTNSTQFLVTVQNTTAVRDAANGALSGVLNDAAWTVFPNPTNDKLTVQAELDAPVTLTLKLSSMLGETMTASSHSASAGAFTTNLDLSALAAGVYTLEVCDGRHFWVRSIVKR